MYLQREESLSFLSDFKKIDFSKLILTVRSIPTLEAALFGRQDVYRSMSPPGLIVDLILPKRKSARLCLYSRKHLSLAQEAWDYSLNVFNIIARLLKRKQVVTCSKEDLKFACTDKYSYVLMPIIDDVNDISNFTTANCYRNFEDLIFLSALPIFLRKTKRYNFIEEEITCDEFFKIFVHYKEYTIEKFSHVKELSGLKDFLDNSYKNLRTSPNLRNSVQVSSYSLRGIKRMSDGLLYLTRPLFLQYSMVDLKLCEMISTLSDKDSSVLSLLLHVYYDLQVPDEFFDLYVLYSFVKIFSSRQAPYSFFERAEIIDNLLMYKKLYNNFNSKIPKGYKMPVFKPEMMKKDDNSDVSLLFIADYYEENML